MLFSGKQPPIPGKWSRSRGFSLFELVVFIISVAIVYAAAARRFTEFPGEAERANFVAVATQLQTGINLELMLAMTRGQSYSIRAMETANPMDLLLDPPSNYIGAFDVVDSDSIDRRVWYYDRPRGELVYLVNDTEGVFLLIDGRRVPTDEIRFVIQAQYRTEDPETGLPVSQDVAVRNASEGTIDGVRKGRINGMLLKPVIPYKWDTDIMELAGSGILDG